MSKNVPTGVKVISILYYIGAVASVLFGILFIFGGGFFSSLTASIPTLAFLGSAVFIVIGIFLLLLGILNFFIGRGLWKGRNWARILVIIFSILGILMALMSLIFSGAVANFIFSVIINGLIGGYLLFSPKVKNAFSSS